MCIILLRFDAVYLCQLNYLRLSLHFNKMNIKCVRPGITVLGEQLVPDSETPWTVAHQATLSMEFPRQEY